MGSRIIIVALVGVAVVLPGCGSESSGPGPHVPQPMDFFVAFPANVDLTQTAALSVKITARPATGGTVTVPGLSLSTAFTTDGSGLATVTLPDTVMLNAWDTILPRGVIVHADDSAGILAISDKTGSMHPAILIPAAELGVGYRVLSAGAGGLSDGSFLAVVATQNGTTVTITPSVTAGARAAGTPYQLSMSRGDAYQLEATGTAGDLSGTQVQADKPVAVFGGHMLGQVPGGTSFAGLLWSAMPPLGALTGKDFFAFPFNHRTGYWLRLMGLQDGTTVTTVGISGAPATLNAGQVVDVRTMTAARITTLYPILVAQLAEGNSADTVAGADPCLTLVPPVTGFNTSYLFTAPSDQVGTIRVNLVAPTSAVGTITLNGNVVGAGTFSAIGSTGYSGASVSLSAAVSQVAGGSPFGLVVYGWDVPTGYNGFCFAPGAGF